MSRVDSVISLARCRPGEAFGEATVRVATDAIYAARDDGGTMHDAGAASARAVLALHEDVAAIVLLREVQSMGYGSAEFRQRLEDAIGPRPR